MQKKIAIITQHRTQQMGKQTRKEVHRENLSLRSTLCRITMFSQKRTARGYIDSFLKSPVSPEKELIVEVFAEDSNLKL